MRLPCHGYGNEIRAADDAIGRIEFDRVGAGQIDLTPCMRRAAAVLAMTRTTAAVAQDNDQGMTIRSVYISGPLGDLEPLRVDAGRSGE